MFPQGAKPPGPGYTQRPPPSPESARRSVAVGVSEPQPVEGRGLAGGGRWPMSCSSQPEDPSLREVAWSVSTKPQQFHLQSGPSCSPATGCPEDSGAGRRPLKLPAPAVGGALQPQSAQSRRGPLIPQRLRPLPGNRPAPPCSAPASSPWLPLPQLQRPRQPHTLCEGWGGGPPRGLRR